MNSNAPENSNNFEFFPPYCTVYKILNLPMYGVLHSMVLLVLLCICKQTRRKEPKLNNLHMYSCTKPPEQIHVPIPVKNLQSIGKPSCGW